MSILISAHKSPIMTDIFGIYKRPDSLTHFNIIIAVDIALVRADQKQLFGSHVKWK